MRAYAIVRTDLGMTAGKIASQAGHAYIGAVEAARTTDKFRAQTEEYLSLSPGTKVCLAAKHEGEIDKICKLADLHGIPHFRVIDSGCLDFHGGRPITTAVGLGPLRKHQAKKLTKNLRLL